jgi:hypothetical protein
MDRLLRTKRFSISKNTQFPVFAHNQYHRLNIRIFGMTQTLHPKNFYFRYDSNTAPGTSLLVLQRERRNCRTRTCILKYGVSNLFSYTSHNQRIGRFRASTALSGYMIHKVFRMILKVFRSSDAMMEQLRDSSILAREDLHEELRRLCIWCLTRCLSQPSAGGIRIKAPYITSGRMLVRQTERYITTRRIDGTPSPKSYRRSLIYRDFSSNHVIFTNLNAFVNIVILWCPSQKSGSSSTRCLDDLDERDIAFKRHTWNNKYWRSRGTGIAIP